MRKPRRRAILKSRGFVRSSNQLKQVIYRNPNSRVWIHGMSSNRNWEKLFRYFARRNKLSVRHRYSKRKRITTTYFSEEFREMCRIRVDHGLLDQSDETGKKVIDIQNSRNV